MTASATDSDLTFNATTNTLSSSNISIGNDLGVTGATTLTGNLAVTAPSTISGYGTIPIGGIIMWSGAIANIPTGWALCNDQTVNGIKTPDLRNRFVVGAHSGAGTGTVETAGPEFNADNGTLSSSYTPGNSGGFTGIGLTIGEMPSHSHQLYNQIGGGGNSVGGGGSNTSDNQSGAAGGNKFHENRPPYYALAFIMRIS
jgi:microcystin-dependent protein